MIRVNSINVDVLLTRPPCAICHVSYDIQWAERKKRYLKYSRMARIHSSIIQWWHSDQWKPWRGSESTKVGHTRATAYQWQELGTTSFVFDEALCHWRTVLPALWYQIQTSNVFSCIDPTVFTLLIVLQMFGGRQRTNLLCLKYSAVPPQLRVQVNRIMDTISSVIYGSTWWRFIVLRFCIDCLLCFYKSTLNSQTL